MDNTPNYANSPVEQKPSRKKTIWLVIIILALIASNTGWALFYLKQQGEMTAKINTLTAQNAKLAEDNKELQSENDKASADSDAAYREIPELGVKYKLDDVTKKLTYNYRGDIGSGAINWTTVDLANKSTGEDSCNSFDMSVVTWTNKKIEGTNDESKKIGKVTIYHSAEDELTRPAACNDKTLLDAAKAAEKRAFNSLQAI